jgi:membrane protease YdiL (CAAX protease family)
MALLRLLGEPDVRPPGVSAYSIAVLLSSMLVTALIAGIFEEAAYRGYLRRELEGRYGPALSILLAALVFALAHLTRGREYLVVLPLVFVFGCLYGTVAWKTGSILPGIVVHSSYNFLRLLERWLAPSPWLGTSTLLVIAAGLTVLALLCARGLRSRAVPGGRVPSV